jgi:hypothetical protein
MAGLTSITTQISENKRIAIFSLQNYTGETIREAMRGWDPVWREMDNILFKTID